MARSALIALAVVTALLVARPSARADPYEIPAHWVESEDMLSPIGVDFAFTRIESVVGLGVVAYGDRLLLRIADEESPYVTLGIAGRRFADDPLTYTSMAPLGDGARLMTVSRVVGDAAAFTRETELERVDLQAAEAAPTSFPVPGDAASAWSSIALFTATDGEVLALASRTRPITRPALDLPPSPALEQRVFALDNAGWAPRASLDPASLTLADACLAGKTLVAVGTKLVRDASGAIVERRGGAAVLTGSAWAMQELARPARTTAWSLDAVACGPTRGYVAAVGSTAADAESISRGTLLGGSVLYLFDGKSWRELGDHPGAPKHEASAFTRVSAIGVGPDRSLWAAYERPDDPAHELYRYSGGEWRAYALPPVPTVASYVIRGIAFDEQGKGWAISNLEGSADHPEWRGILLRFDGNAWEEQPWTWSPLKQRWFGLFGNLS